MKRLRGLIVAGVLLLACAGQAEAGVGTGLKNLWSYAISPVPCLLNLSTAIVGALTEFGRCFIGNMNRSPLSLSGPVIPLLPSQ